MGDTNMCTDNPVLLRNTYDTKTIICSQKKADKCIPKEDDIVLANKLAFNDDIGVVTNYVTSMFDVQAGCKKGSKEYRVLAYRIMCGQHYQQETIDRIKGIIAKPMPTYWYSYRDCITREGDSKEACKQKRFNRRIVASKKPYFMTYVYPELRKKNNTYIKNCKAKAVRLFHNYGIRSLEDLQAYEPKTKAMKDFLYYYEEHMPTGGNPCVVNRICWLAEEELGGIQKHKLINAGFDYSILKSNVGYSRYMYNRIVSIYDVYRKRMAQMQNRLAREKTNSLDYDAKYMFMNFFIRNCLEACPNEDELCDIILDMCYGNDGMKAFAWDIVGDVIVQNLLKRNGHKVHIPVCDDEGDFEFAGKGYKLCEIGVPDGNDNPE